MSNGCWLHGDDACLGDPSLSNDNNTLRREDGHVWWYGQCDACLFCKVENANCDSYPAGAARHPTKESEDACAEHPERMRKLLLAKMRE